MNVVQAGLALMGICLLRAVSGEATCREDVICEHDIENIIDNKADRDKTCCLDEGETDCKKCLVTREGNLNIILAFPHGGGFKPNSYTSRKYGCNISDTCEYNHDCNPNTDNCGGDDSCCESDARLLSDYRSNEVGYKIYKELLALTGKCPSFIMSIVHRTWLDPNRNDTDTDGLATFKEPVMMKIYEWYHGNMSALVENMKGPGILFDMHGYNNEAVDWTIIGNMLKEEDLISGDLDKIAERSSIKRLVARTGEKLSNLLQGQHSLGAYIEEGIVNKEAIKAVPSKTNPHPDEKKFFAAADSPITKDLRDKIDVFQIEMHKKYRNNEVQLDLFQTDYAKALANAFLKLVERYYDGCVRYPCNGGTSSCSVGADGFSCSCNSTVQCPGMNCTNTAAGTGVQQATIKPIKSIYGNSECIRYECEPDYTLLTGDLSRTCEKGHWSGSPPVCTSQDRRKMKTLEVTNGASWGSWTNDDFCPQGSYAIGYEMKIEGKQGNTGDDTSLNGIRLLCGEGLKNLSESKAVSGEAPWGDWGTEARCIDGHFITSFKLQVEFEQGTSGDATAANYMQVRCRELETANDGNVTYPGTGKGYWGTYGNWSESCAVNTAVCGIQTRIESSLGSEDHEDDTALNDVKLFCCDWDLKIGNCKNEICYNGGICEDLFQDFRCMCKPSFTGRHCEEPNDCEGVNCNKGVCLDLSNDYRCLCEPNFTGKHCETDRRYMTTLEVTNGGQWGGWNNDDFCPQGSYAIGYNMKIEGKLDSGDDTSLNGIRLICGNGFENFSESYIVSGEAPWGDWGTAAKCSDGEFITSFKLQVESYQGDPGDDTAANYMQVRCRKLETANNGTTIPDTGNGHWGTYGDWSEGCVANTAVCGIQTKIEPPQAHGVDDTALNDVKLYCCQWDLVIHEFLVTLKDVVSPFKKEMANFGSPTFQAYVLSIKPMIDEMCNASNSLACEVFELLPGSVQIQLAITSMADPTEGITTFLEDGNYTSFEMTSVTKRTVKCEKGQYLNNASNGCLECEKGSYTNFTLGMPCNPCLPGYYQDQKGQTQCKKCKAGNFSSTTGSEACTQCPLGHFSLEGASYCTKCSPGTVAESEGQPSCVACNPGTEPNTESSHCKNCSAGTFSESGIECKTVPPGSAARPGQSSFTLCSAGTEPSADLMTCLNCSAGTFSSNGVQCLSCGNGSYSTLGSEVCTPCPAGFIPYSDHSGCSSCPAGSFSNSGDQACKPCESGSVSVGGQPNCTDCNPGTVPNEPKSECLNCSAGLYSRSGSQCLRCDQHQYSHTGAASCSLCANGSVPNLNNAGCTKCQPGYYAVSGFAECRHCEDGTMSSSPGKSECAPCNGGKIPNHDNSDCNPCIAGTWSATGDTACTECPNGTISSDGQASCSECDNGSAPNAQKSVCDFCLAGSYAVHGFEQCLPCANGTYSTPGSADCMTCPAGSIPNSNQSGCDPCPPGNWSNSGDGECRPCDAGSFSPGGQPNCSKCNAGTVPNINQSACKNCSAGFNSYTGDVECSPCPRDLWSLPGFSFCKECKLNEMPRKDQTGCVPSIAFNKPTKPKAKKYNSSDAVDGDFYNTCSRTKKTWKVVLDGWYKVKKVVIQSTNKCCGYELQDLKVYVKQKNGKYKVCGKYTGPAATGERVYIKCDLPIVGKRVKIEKTSKGALVMCEVFVLGKQADPPKSGKKARKNRRKAKKAGRKEKNKN